MLFVGRPLNARKAQEFIIYIYRQWDDHQGP